MSGIFYSGGVFVIVTITRIQCVALEGVVVIITVNGAPVCGIGRSKFLIVIVTA
jgi:hypothetical protein